MSSPERGDELEALRLETRPAPTLPLIMAASISGLTLAVVAAISLVPVTQVLSVPGAAGDPPQHPNDHQPPAWRGHRGARA